MDPYEDYINKSDKSKNDSDEEEDLEKLEVVKEFTLDFEKKLAKYIPPKIKFGTDLSNLSIITTVYLKEEEFISNLKLFMGYFILSTVKAIHFYDKTYVYFYCQKGRQLKTYFHYILALFFFFGHLIAKIMYDLSIFAIVYLLLKLLYFEEKKFLFL